MHRVESINDGSQVYLNTGTWTTRYALPEPEEITPQLISWLRRPDWTDVPLRDMTQSVFAFIHSNDDSVSNATLCAWEGGENGTYRILT